MCHDDVIKWMHFPRYWSFVRWPVTGGFPSQRPVMWNFDVFFDLHLNKWLSKHSRHWWFEMPSHSLWCHCKAGTAMTKFGSCIYIYIYCFCLTIIWKLFYAYQTKWFKGCFDSLSLNASVCYTYFISLSCLWHIMNLNKICEICDMSYMLENFSL